MTEQRRYEVRREFSDGTFDIYSLVADSLEEAKIRARYSDSDVVAAYVVGSFDLAPQRPLAFGPFSAAREAGRRDRERAIADHGSAIRDRTDYYGRRLDEVEIAGAIDEASGTVYSDADGGL